MPKTCSFCNLEFPSGAPQCLTCGRPAPSPNGYPNVFLAQQSQEIDELNNRYRTAIDNSVLSGNKGKIDEFEDLIRTESRLVTACFFNKFRNFTERENAVFPVFQRLVEAEIEYPDEQIDYDRLPAEEATLPGCSKDIRYAALSVADQGIAHYGNYLLIWDLDKTAHRTSLFHANCVEWRKVIGIAMNDPMPPGYRSQWEDRHLLAVAKHSKDINISTSVTEFSNILIRNKGDNEEYDVFIEAHIWGHTTRRSLLKIICLAEEKKEVRRLTVEEIVEELQNIGIEVEVT